MQTSLLWAGREYYSLENCLITSPDEKKNISSTIIGYYQSKIYTATYFIQTDNNWLTYFLKLNYQINNKYYNLNLERDENNSWTLNDKKANGFDGCLYVDVSITPFTNTLPVNHLQLGLNERHKINVIYINIFEQEVKAVEHVYQKLSDTTYLYQNVPNDFEATIQFDESGFVVDYPYLFKRAATIKI